MKTYRLFITAVMMRLERRGWQAKRPCIYSFVLMVLYPSDTPKEHAISIMLYCRVVARRYAAKVDQINARNKNNPWFN